MALKISTEEDDVPSEGDQSASDRELRILVICFVYVISIIWGRKNTTK